MSVDWPRAPTVSQLRAEFGAVGPLVFVNLLCEAQRQFYATTKSQRRDGRVKVGWVDLAHLSGCTAAEVEEVVQRLEGLCIIHIEETHGIGCDAVFLDWAKWTPAGPPTDPENADRQARFRAKQKDEESVTE